MSNSYAISCDFSKLLSSLVAFVWVHLGYKTAYPLLRRIQNLTKGGSDKSRPKAVAPRGVRGHARPENF